MLREPFGRMSQSNAIDFGPRYGVLRELGSGGMGRVFLVEDLHLRRELALKVLHRPPDDSAGIRQARQEFTLLAQIEHPNIARAFDFGFLGDVPFFTSEYVPGSTLEDAGSRLGVESLLTVARSIAAAMECLHRGGILHLDIKPSNIIASPREGQRRAVLIDFGLCRRSTGSGPAAPMHGSFPYMAPEYFLGGEIGSWTDVYAFGVTLYRVSTGRYPRSFEPRSVESVDDRSVWARPAAPTDADSFRSSFRAGSHHPRVPGRRPGVEVFVGDPGFSMGSATRTPGSSRFHPRRRPPTSRRGRSGEMVNRGRWSDSWMRFIRARRVRTSLLSWWRASVAAIFSVKPSSWLKLAGSLLTSNEDTRSDRGPSAPSSAACPHTSKRRAPANGGSRSSLD